MGIAPSIPVRPESGVVRTALAGRAAPERGPSGRQRGIGHGDPPQVVGQASPLTLLSALPPMPAVIAAAWRALGLDRCLRQPSRQPRRSHVQRMAPPALPSSQTCLPHSCRKYGYPEVSRTILSSAGLDLNVRCGGGDGDDFACSNRVERANRRKVEAPFRVRLSPGYSSGFRADEPKSSPGGALRPRDPQSTLNRSTRTPVVVKCRQRAKDGRRPPVGPSDRKPGE